MLVKHCIPNKSSKAAWFPCNIQQGTHTSTSRRCFLLIPEDSVVSRSGIALRMIHISSGAHSHHRLTVPSYSIQGWLGNGTNDKGDLYRYAGASTRHMGCMQPEPFPLSFVDPFSFVPLAQSKLTPSRTVDTAPVSILAAAASIFGRFVRVSSGCRSVAIMYLCTEMWWISELHPDFDGRETKGFLRGDSWT